MSIMAGAIVLYVLIRQVQRMLKVMKQIKNENLFLKGKIIFKTLSIIGDEMDRNGITR